MENPSLTEKAKRIVEIFTRRGKKICVAESCTGGLVASSIVSISGASAVFLGSAVCFCDEAKMKILSVKKEILEKYYSESLQCSQAMAHGAISIFNADYAIATTGFLDANVAPKPADLAGKVFVCLCKKDDFGNLNFECDELLLDTSCQRNVNRAKVAERALDMLLR